MRNISSRSTPGLRKLLVITRCSKSAIFTAIVLINARWRRTMALVTA